jgi:hypothetical protein
MVFLGLVEVHEGGQFGTGGFAAVALRIGQKFRVMSRAWPPRLPRPF